MWLLTRDVRVERKKEKVAMWLNACLLRDLGVLGSERYWSRQVQQKSDIIWSIDRCFLSVSQSVWSVSPSVSQSVFCSVCGLRLSASGFVFIDRSRRDNNNNNTHTQTKAKRKKKRENSCIYTVIHTYERIIQLDTACSVFCLLFTFFCLLFFFF